jgi:hypothetical protein
MGSRYGGLKQLDPVGPNGELIIDYSIYDALKAGFGKIVFILSGDIEKAFRERIGSRIERFAQVEYVIQRLGDVPEGFEVPSGRKKPWGTGHAVLSCRDAVDTPFAVINADDFYGPSSFRILFDFLENAQEQSGGYHFCMIGFRIENTLTDHGHVARGLCAVDGMGYLSEIKERTRIQKFGENARYTENGENWVDIEKGSIVSMNMWGFTPGIFKELASGFTEFLTSAGESMVKSEFFLPGAVSDLMASGKAAVRVLQTPEQWRGVTYREDKPSVTQFISEMIKMGIYPERLWEL